MLNLVAHVLLCITLTVAHAATFTLEELLLLLVFAFLLVVAAAETLPD